MCLCAVCGILRPMLCTYPSCMPLSFLPPSPTPGMTFVPPRVAAWRYLRGSRSLASNLSDGSSASVAATAAFDACTADVTVDTKAVSSSDDKDDTAEGEEDSGDDAPDELEDIVDHLLSSLRDKGEWLNI